MEIIFNRVHSKKDLAISSTILAAGIGLYFANAALGILIALCGMFMLLFYKDSCKRAGNDTLLKRKVLELSAIHRDSMMDFLNGKASAPDMSSNSKGALIRMEIYYNTDASVAYAQLYDYINYCYVPASGIVELKGERAEKLIKIFKEAK